MLTHPTSTFQVGRMLTHPPSNMGPPLNMGPPPSTYSHTALTYGQSPPTFTSGPTAPTQLLHKPFQVLVSIYNSATAFTDDL